MTRLIVKRAIAMCSFGGIVLYFVLVKNSASTAEKLILTSVTLAILASLWWKRLYDHPAYGSILLCCAMSFLFIGSWRSAGLHAQNTLVDGMFLIVVVLLSVAKIALPKER